ncbi:MAG: sigma-70 family RNA polymerase sigma factor [Planctomycetales bacterium]|nr:sigma-70 family RNA polymerase sigma factor [Planctomycetales bacterium]
MEFWAEPPLMAVNVNQPLDAPGIGHQESEDEPSFASLLKQLQSGSEEAAAIIVERFTPHVLRAVRSSLPQAIRSKVDSIDLVNTLFGAILLKRTYLGDLREPAQLIALLTKVARDRVIQESRKYRAQARDIRREEPMESGVPTSHQDQPRQLARDLRLGSSATTASTALVAREKWKSVLSELSERDRRIIGLRSEGFTSKEIAEKVTGVSSRTVRRVVNDAIKRLLE